MIMTQRISLESAQPSILARGLRLRVLANLTYGEPELKLVPSLCDPDGVSIDVGSNRGVYAAVMSLHSFETHAFEPNPHLFRSLQRSLARTVSVQRLALSDRSGTANLRIPVFGGRAFSGRGSIECGNDFGEPGRIESINVEVRPLDSFSFRRIGLVKIDVEGHEAAVLRGAQETLARDRPNLIVESESRHNENCPEAIFGSLASLGYHGFFQLKGRLRPIAAFQRHKHQNRRSISRYGKIPGNVYVNNFIFVHGTERVRQLAALVSPGGGFEPRNRFAAESAGICRR